MKGGTVTMAGAVEGKEGWLFLTNDSNRTWEQFGGTRLIDPMELRAWRTELERRRRAFDLLGVTYRFMIAPNKETILHDYVPDGSLRGSTTPLDQLMAIVEHEPYFLDLRAAFLNAEKREDLYHRGDTHWNDVGGLLATNALISSLPGDLNMRPIAAGDIRRKEAEAVGDLGNKFDPEVSTNMIYADFCAGLRRSRLVYHNDITNHGRIEVHEGGSETGPTMIVFGDSFAGRVVHWLKERVRRLVRVHSTSIDFQIVVDERPDIVVSMIVERFILKAPQPCVSFSIREDITRKLGSNPTCALFDEAPLTRKAAREDNKLFRDMITLARLTAEVQRVEPSLP